MESDYKFISGEMDKRIRAKITISGMREIYNEYKLQIELEKIKREHKIIDLLKMSILSIMRWIRDR